MSAPEPQLDEQQEAPLVEAHFPDDHYTLDQLVDHAETLFEGIPGATPWTVGVALGSCKENHLGLQEAAEIVRAHLAKPAPNNRDDRL